MEQLLSATMSTFGGLMKNGPEMAKVLYQNPSGVTPFLGGTTKDHTRIDAGRVARRRQGAGL